MLTISRVARDQVWYERSLFYNSNFSIPNGSASLFEIVILKKKFSAKMISVWGRGRSRKECPFIFLFDSFSPFESDDNLSY